MKLVPLLLLVFVTLVNGCGAPRVASSQREAIEAMRNLDAEVELDEATGMVLSISLKGAKVTDDVMLHFKDLTSLQTLELTDTKVTDAGVKELQLALPKCDISWK